MPSIYTPSATVHGSYVLPSDGDPAVAESVNDSLRDLADGVLNANTAAAAAVALASQMVNGVTGGNYSPTSDIQIRSDLGGGFVVDGNMIHEGGTLTLRSDSVLNGTGQANFSGAFNVSGTGTISGEWTFTNFVTINASTTVNANLRAHGSLTELGADASDNVSILGAAAFDASATFNGTAFFQGLANFDQTINARDILATVVTLYDVMAFTQSGRIPFRTATLNSSATVTVTDGNVFFISTNINGIKTYTISDANAQDGDFMLFMSGASDVIPYQITISSPTFGQSVTWSSAINSQWNLYIRHNGEWFKMNFGAGYT